LNNKIENRREFPFLLFEKADFALLIIDFNKREIIYSNDYFNVLQNKTKKSLFDGILNNILTIDDEKNNINHELILDVKESYIYSIYSLFTDYYFVLIRKEIMDERVKQEKMGFKIISNIVSEISHEIGNPLTSIRTALEVMLRNIDAWDKEKKRKYINMAIKGVDRITDYLTDIKDFSINKTLNIKKLNLKEIIDSIVNDNIAIFESRDIDIIVNINSDIFVYADKTVIYQVILNLMLNSNQVLEDNGKIEIRGERFKDSFIKLIYRNNGPPIPDSIKEKIFIPYFSTKNIRKDIRRGIGLAISLKLINKMGGTIILEEPEKGWGVQFAIYIPVINYNN
jgi:signal transduction histidine kinase